MNKRVLLTTQTAMRDPEVWGADVDEFKLRPLNEYEERSVAWVEQAVDNEQPQHSRSCVGKELSLSMITGNKINMNGNTTLTNLIN